MGGGISRSLELAKQLEDSKALGDVRPNDGEKLDYMVSKEASSLLL